MHNTEPKKAVRHRPVPQQDLSIIITIPASSEPGILQTLSALTECARPDGSVEVAVVLNSAEKAGSEVIDTNEKTEKQILSFSAEHSNDRFRIRCFHEKGIPEKLAGAGYARKIAMDYAAGMFDRLDRPDGIILSLDADTLCEQNYLTEVERHFRNNPASDACSIYFEHPVQGNAYPERIYQGIIQYEIHLRYYIQALRYAGHPHAYHTLGSCFAVRAGVYAQQGGMNKRKAGEDFYFLHKIIPLGNFHEINTTCLKPSPRPSLRVPFGTGPVTSKFLTGEIRSLSTYHPAVFDDLRDFLATVPLMYLSRAGELERQFLAYPPSIRENLKTGFFDRIGEIRKNCRGEAAFRKRFFRWFNVFRVLKFINQAHRDHYDRLPVDRAAGDFLQKTDPHFVPSSSKLELLEHLRRVQRNV